MFDITVFRIATFLRKKLFPLTALLKGRVSALVSTCETSHGLPARVMGIHAVQRAEPFGQSPVSSVRSKMERAFGILKRGYGFFRARYLGLAKVELDFLLNAMAFNLKKAVLKVDC
ncbi:MAG: transposase [Solidesulfovibrio sp. DCME]|uniref:transposase n=1 Tax=Solidesulfovibrio sp. DCME TaxID=3447380 RepID=UPI003D137CA3